MALRPSPLSKASGTHSGPTLGARIAILRRARGLTLAQLAAALDLSEATLSRIEKGSSSISAHHLFAMANFLGIDIAEFFREDAAPLAPGMRSLTRRGEGVAEDLDRLKAEVLCADLSKKTMHPAINTIAAKTLEEAGGLASHAGEEFLYVLEGRIVLQSELYAPTELSAGDSLYFDGSQPHAYINAGKAPARVLIVVSGRPPGQVGS